MDRSHIYDTFARAPLAFERGEGVWLYTADGRRYLDFTGGIAVNSLGHAHPHLVAALTEQAQKLWHVSNLFEIPGQEKLAATLCAHTFADKVFFGNSGTEATECAIKTVRRYHFVAGHPERYRIITFAGAFHGRTLAALAATGNPKYIEGMGPKADGFDQVPLGDIKAVEAAITPETAAIFIEPIQGEGGVRTPSNQFLRELRALCDKHGLLLVFDEVQTGVGRTGKLFAYQWTGVSPDVMTVAKGGHKMKAVETEGSPSFKTGKMNLTGTGATLSQLTDFISHELRFPVIDQTGLKGRFDYFLDIGSYVTEEMMKANNGSGPPPDAPTIVAQAMLAQLGLKLDSKKAPVELLIIDTVEKTPAEN